ncbi:MAG: hypothetical protein ACLQBK_02270 [Candidatus Sulfotelmatobacter sp.]
MIGKLLWPLLYPLAAAAVGYLRSRYRRKWDFVSLLGAPHGPNNKQFRREDLRSALDGLRSSFDMSCYIYLAVWLKEIGKAWQTHPALLLTVVALLLMAPVRSFAPRRGTENSELPTND